MSNGLCVAADRTTGARLVERSIFFACGAPKSGTTWLQRILDAHPQIQCSGEGHFIERVSMPFARVLNDYAGHMKLVAESVYEGQPPYPPLVQADLDQVVRDFIISRLMTRNPGPEIRWIGDKTPRYSIELPALQRLFPQARFIHIVRDPRDVAVSRVHHTARGGHQDRVAGEALIQFVRNAAQVWLETVKRVSDFTAKNPDVIHTVRYEAMLADPRGETRKMLRFLGADHDDALVDRISDATSFEAMSGRKPGKEDPDSFLRKGVAGDWVGRLEPEVLAALDETCGSAMRDWGYR